MKSHEPQQSEDGSIRDEIYYAGYSSDVVQSFTARAAGREAAFFLPHLRPGMRLLDCGCGPGSITLGLAKVVDPGEVVGIDIESSQITLAQSRAVQRGTANIHFQTGNIYALPFATDSFDVVFSHGVLSYLTDQTQALREMGRVLKPGGVIGLRNVDLGGWLLAPANTAIEEELELIERVAAHNGATHQMGRNLRSLLHRTGFVRCEASASYEYCGTVETTQARAEIEARRVETAPLFQQILDLGWADGPTLKQLAAAWREWGQQPDAFLARAWCEAVGWKVGESETA